MLFNRFDGQMSWTSRVSSLHAKAFFVALAATALANIYRYSHASFAKFPFLWAEDGQIFAPYSGTDAKGLLEPAAGYYQLVPRFVGFVAMYFPAHEISVVFLTFTLVFQVLAVSIAALFLLQAGVRSSVTFLGLLAWLLQPSPNSPELFFNLTNLQWWLGVAFALILVERISALSKLGPSRLALLALLSLTGPFVIYFAPLATFLLALREGRRSITDPVTNILTFGFTVQLLQLISSGRFPFLDLISELGLGAILVPISMQALGVITGLCLHSLLPSSDKSLRHGRVFSAFALILLGSGAALVAVLGSQSLVSGRYSWVPYALTLFSILLLSCGKPLLQGFFLSTLLLLNTFVWPSNHWELPEINESQTQIWIDSQGGFAQVHPVWDSYPSWRMFRESAHPRAEVWIDVKPSVVEAERWEFEVESCSEQSELFAIYMDSPLGHDAFLSLQRSDQDPELRFNLSRKGANVLFAFENLGREREIFVLKPVRGHLPALNNFSVTMICLIQ